MEEVVKLPEASEEEEVAEAAVEEGGVSKDTISKKKPSLGSKEDIEVDVSGKPMQAMDVKSSFAFFDEYADTASGWFGRARGMLPGSYVLVTDDNARIYSLRALQFNVLCNAINTKLLNPNYAIMVKTNVIEASITNTSH